MEFVAYPFVENLYRVSEDTGCISENRVLRELLSIAVVVQEKIDGTNICVSWLPDEGRFDYYSRNGHTVPPLIEQVLHKTFIPDKWEGREEALIYGEAFGPGIQKKGMSYGPEKRFAVFDVLHPSGRFMNLNSMTEYCSEVGVEVVPRLEESILLSSRASQCPIWSIMEGEEIYMYTEDDFRPEVTSVIPEEGLFRNQKPEGVILRPALDLLDNRGKRVMFKHKPADLHSHYCAVRKRLKLYTQ